MSSPQVTDSLSIAGRSGDVLHVAPTVEEALAELDAIAERVEALRGRMRLARAAAASERSPSREPGTEALVRLEVGGAKAGRRNAVQANGSLVGLQDALFGPFVRFVVAHLRHPGSWSTRGELGIARSAWVTSRIRRAFKGVVPVGFDLIEPDRRERFRLNPAVVVLGVDWAALAMHPDPAVRSAVAAWRERAGIGGARER